MAQWLVDNPWPSGPSFVSDSLTGEALHSREIVRSCVLASVGTGFGGEVGKASDYPQQILTEGDSEDIGTIPVETPVDDC